MQYHNIIRELTLWSTRDTMVGLHNWSVMVLGICMSWRSSFHFFWPNPFSLDFSQFSQILRPSIRNWGNVPPCSSNWILCQTRNLSYVGRTFKSKREFATFAAKYGLCYITYLCIHCTQSWLGFTTLIHCVWINTHTYVQYSGLNMLLTFRELVLVKKQKHIRRYFLNISMITIIQLCKYRNNMPTTDNTVFCPKNREEAEDTDQGVNDATFPGFKPTNQRDVLQTTVYFPGRVWKYGMDQQLTITDSLKQFNT